jgi:two-component system response regulator
MHGKTIMLVEDNPDDEALTLRAFKKNNVLNEVVLARDGVEALNYLLGSASGGLPGARALPQVVLLDLKLPKIDGLEVLRRLRADPRTHNLPVVMLTSSGEESDILRCYELGVNSYIRKPVDFTKFVEAVQQLHLYWMVLNETALCASGSS